MEETQINLSKYSRLLWKKKLIIVFLTLLIASGGIVYSLLLPFQYESMITLYPSAPSSGSSIFSTLSAKFGLGVDQDKSLDPTVLFTEVLRSRSFTEKFSRQKFFSEKHGKEVELRELFEGEAETEEQREKWISMWISELFSVEKDNITGVTKITVLAPEARLSADIANQVIHSLKYFFDNNTTGRMQQNRVSIEKNEAIAKDAFDKAVFELSLFNSKNRDTDLMHSPQLFRKFTDLNMEMEIQKQKYTMLRTELESVKIEEIKERPFIRVLDSAYVPTTKKYPERKKIAVYSTLAGFVIACTLIFMFDFYQQNRKKLRSLIKEEFSD